MRVPVCLLSIVVTLWLCPASAGERARSLSMGTPTYGRLVGGRKMPLSSPHHRVISVTRERGFVYGTQELIGLIQRMSRRVSRRHRGVRLQVANLSRRGGGDIPQSVTHNSGREVDIPFFARDRKGRLVPEVGFVHFDSKGRGGDLRFDAALNWAVVKAALMDTDVQVQTMLCARWLQRLMIAHARKKGEPAWLIKRAQAVLHHPARAAPHDDHFHLRIYCARHERLEGCINVGRIHAWAKTYDDDVKALVRKKIRQFDDRDADVARSAIEHVTRLQARGAAGALIKALKDERPEVRGAALTALVDLHAVEDAEPTLVRLARKAEAGEWRARLVELLASRSVTRARAVFARLVGDPDAGADTRTAAARGLGAVVASAEVPALIQVVADRTRPVREAAGEALYAITGFKLGVGRRARKTWEAWWAHHRGDGRTAWLADAFAARHGYSLTRRTCARALRALVRDVRRGGATSEHARHLIRKLTGFRARSSRVSDRRLYREYSRWLRKGGARRCRTAPARLSQWPVASDQLPVSGQLLVTSEWPVASDLVPKTGSW